MPGERRETVAEQSVPTHAADTMAYQVATDVRALRAFVSAGALARGLSRDRVELLTLAVSELATNTLQHTTGGGWVRLWAEPGQLFCDVVDQGRRGRSAGACRPPTRYAVAGWRSWSRSVTRSPCSPAPVRPSYGFA